MSTKKISEIADKATSAEIGDAKLVAAIPSGDGHVTKYIEGNDLTSSEITVTYAGAYHQNTPPPSSTTLTSMQVTNQDGTVGATTMTFFFANGRSLVVETTSNGWG